MFQLDEDTDSNKNPAMNLRKIPISKKSGKGLLDGTAVIGSPLASPFKKKTLAGLLKGKSMITGGHSGLFGSKFTAFKQETLLKRNWIEMKFQSETPSCRTLHA